MKIRSRSHSRGFTLVEAVVCVAVVLFLSAVVVHRVQNARSNAQTARYRANVNQLQSAYERAKLTCPALLTNESVGLFAANAAESALLSAPLSADDLAQIVLASGTSIPGKTALFVLRTNSTQIPDGVPQISIVQPANGQVFIAGKPITLLAEVQSTAGIVSVAFADNNQPLATVYTQPYTLNVNAGIGTHSFTATATDANNKSTTASVGITVIANHAPTILWNGTIGGVFNVGTTLSLSVTAMDEDPGDRITRVEFYAGPDLLASLVDSPFTFPWTGPAGVYQVTAKAYDDNGGSAATVPLQIQIVDNVAPTMSLSPTSITLDSYPDTVDFNATAQDADGSIVAVQFYLDGALVLTDTQAPYSWTWQTTPGNHEIQAVAQDNGGKTVSRTCTAQIGNNQKPAVAVTSPATGSTFWTGAVLTLTASASDADGSISSVKFYANGTLIATDTTSPYSTTWTPTAGNYSLTAVATDNQNATRTSSAISVQIKAPESLVWNILQSGASISSGNFNGSFKGASSTQTISQNGRVEIDIASTAYWEMGLSTSSDPSTSYSSWLAGINVSGNGNGGVQRCDVKVPGWNQNYTLFLGGSDTLVIEVVNNQVRIYTRLTDGSIRASTPWGAIPGTLYVHLYNNNLSSIYGVTGGAIYR
ncbi:MAG: hypothetical protein ABS95_02270 [Verrucomicrobia bacterium SCN 57-15]|nr:MAG: hypothetical protein ABS95_02270 [Verrucomicrobia bacterium SCN 57-15]